MINKIRKKIRHFTGAVKRTFGMNIATIFFGFILIYIISNLVLYAVSDHVDSYQVTEGTLNKNPIVTGLILRDEEVIYAEENGYTRYLAEEGSHVRSQGTVYALSDTPYEAENITLPPEKQKNLRTRMADFSKNYDPVDFYDTYILKYELQGNIFRQANAEESNTFPGNKAYQAPEEGIVMYSSDGYEKRIPETLTDKDLDPKLYEKKSLMTKEEVKPGDPVYRLIREQSWKIVFPVSDKFEDRIRDHTNVRLKFLKDGACQNGSLSLVENESGKLAVVTCKNGMIRYAADRFLKVELQLNKHSGLKIPVSSIVTKDFYKIPSSYMIRGDNADTTGFLRQGSGKNGADEFIDAPIYKNTEEELDDLEKSYQKEGYCYVDRSALKKGDVLIKPDSEERFVVGDTDYLEGVYCINNGYTLFRQIRILEQNKEFCVVAPHIPYGIAAYDLIAADGDQVEDDEFLTSR